jgi:tRNA A37 threonylcarbamoyladenosine dehydratase
VAAGKQRLKDASVIDEVRPEGAELERRFGGLRRLYGDEGYACVRRARVAVVGLGGVGSWAAEALARSGVARLVLIDLDHVAESNINRQVQASGRTLGMAKPRALAERIADIHPGCDVVCVEDFVTPENWPALLPVDVDAVIDACDQVAAKAALAAWSVRVRVPLVCAGAAGGKRAAQRVEVEDLADTSHDPLLASLRQRLRKGGAAPRTGRIGVRCVFSREAVAAPVQACTTDADDATGDGTLNCHGYGSSVAVTATFGMVAAGEVLEWLQRAAAAARQGAGASQKAAPSTAIM